MIVHVHRFSKAFALICSLCFVPHLRADTVYNIVNVTFSPTSFTTIFGPTSETFRVVYTATNVSPFDLTNVYVFAGRVFINNTEGALVAPGSYQLSNPLLNTQAANAAVFIEPSQTNAFYDSLSAGSSTTPQIPGFLVATSLARSQTVNFTVDFQAPLTVANVRFDGVPTVAVTTTPEPAAFLLLGTGMLGIAGALKRRIR